MEIDGDMMVKIDRSCPDEDERGSLQLPRWIWAWVLGLHA